MIKTSWESQVLLLLLRVQGRDTISLRRSCLKPDTIRTLMLVKQHLKLEHSKMQALEKEYGFK
ncbi:hypothetical protein HGRIS_001149 [Hohenbuehelia grisea]|uniref:Ribosomal protein S15 n=1 Tax=Hohenbuehelia grisea TaxID=104357 RepID=A0ABR3JQL5_9AGAR